MIATGAARSLDSRERKPVDRATEATADNACDSEQIDLTPAWLQALGIKKSEWQFITKPQLESMTRQEQPEHVRVWGLGMLWATGYQSETAVKQVAEKDLKPWMTVLGRGVWKDGTRYALVPRGPIDFARHLGIDKRFVTRAIDRLEKYGLAKQTGETKGRVRIDFYAKPRPSQVILGVKPDTQNGSLLSEEAREIIAFSRKLRKSFFLRLWDDAVPIQPDLVANPAYQDAIEGACKESREAVARELQQRIEQVNQQFENLRLVVSPDTQTNDAKTDVLDTQMGVGKCGDSKEVSNVQSNYKPAASTVHFHTEGRDRQTDQQPSVRPSASSNRKPKVKPKPKYPEDRAYLKRTCTKSIGRDPTDEEVAEFHDARGPACIEQVAQMIDNNVRGGTKIRTYRYPMKMARAAAPLAADWNNAPDARERDEALEILKAGHS